MDLSKEGKVFAHVIKMQGCNWVVGVVRSDMKACLQESFSFLDSSLSLWLHSSFHKMVGNGQMELQVSLLPA